MDGTARVWDPRDPGRELARFDGHTGRVGVAALGWPGAGSPGDRHHLRGPDCPGVGSPRPRPGAGPLRRPHRRRVGGGGAGLAGPGSPGDRHRLLDGTARVWDPLDPGRELARFDGHTDFVWGVAALEWPGLDHPVVVTASRTGLPGCGIPVDPGRELARFDGHTGNVIGVAALQWPGLDHPVIVTTSVDRTARVWDPRDPGRELARFDGHTVAVVRAAALEWPGLDHPVVVTASLDRTARVWDPLDPGRELARFDGHTGDVYGGSGAGSGPGWITRWSSPPHAMGLPGCGIPVDPGRELARFDGHTGDVWGVAALQWPGLDHPVVVTASSDQTAQVWDPRDPSRELAHLALFGTGHSVFAINQTTLAFGSSRGYLVFDLQPCEDSRIQ